MIHFNIILLCTLNAPNWFLPISLYRLLWSCIHLPHLKDRKNHSEYRPRSVGIIVSTIHENGEF
jgi:hypothetical protein